MPPLHCFLSLCFDHGEQEIKMWGRGGPRVEPLEIPSFCTYFRASASDNAHQMLILNHFWILLNLWALGTYEYFQAFPVVLEKNCISVSKCFHVCTHNVIFSIIKFTNKSKFYRLHLRVIFQNLYRGSLKSKMWGIFRFPVYMKLYYNSMSLFGYSIGA